MEPSAVRDFLTLGFESDFTVSSRYLHDLLPGARHHAEPPSADLLCRIVEGHTTAAGHSEISLPLTGGLDSRGLLGAALTIFTTEAVRCFTIGTAAYPDVVAAQATCAEIGVSHTRLDPDGITWDLDLLIAAADRHANNGNGLLPIDAIMVFEALAAAMGTERPVLSGYFGDASSGHELPNGARAQNEVDPALDAFFGQNNDALADPGRDPRRRARHASFVEDHAELRDRWPGLTTFDLLDVGCRQRRRIRGIAAGAYPSGANPYEDRRWVAAWMGQPVTERQGQSAYRRMLHDAFPAAFAQTTATHRPGSPLDRLRQVVPLGLKLAVRRPKPLVSRFAGRGDPRRNASMREVLRHTTSAFDRSGLVPDIAAAAALDALLAVPTMENYLTTKWTASVGLRLLAQER